MTCSLTSGVAVTGPDRSQPGHDERATGLCVLGGVVGYLALPITHFKRPSQGLVRFDAPVNFAEHKI